MLGTHYDLKRINYFTGEHKGDEYKQINPHCTVPSARDGGPTITESNAILMYAADRDGHDTAYPRDLKQRTEVNRWLLWEASAWFPSCYVYLVENVVKPLLQAQPDEAVIEKEAPRWNQLAKLLDDQLSKTKWLVGDNPTIADIAVASPMHLWEAQKLPLDKYPNLKRWMTEGVEKLPSWQATQGAVEQALLPQKAAAAANGTVNGHSEVRSTLNYTKDVDPKPTELYFYESDAAKDIHLPGDDPHELSIHDGWYRAKEFSIDKEGFSLHDFKTAFQAWEEEEEVREKFYPDVVEFLKSTLGAKRVLVFDHTIRTKKNEAKKLTQETNTSQRAPVMLGK